MLEGESAEIGASYEIAADNVPTCLEVVTTITPNKWLLLPDEAKQVRDEYETQIETSQLVEPKRPRTLKAPNDRPEIVTVSFPLVGVLAGPILETLGSSTENV
jgi:hypothetical protein